MLLTNNEVVPCLIKSQFSAFAAQSSACRFSLAQFFERLLDCLIIALRAEPGNRQGVGLFDAIQFVAEFQIGRDLPRREGHCIVGRESASDEGGDADGNFRKRTL